MEERGRLQAGRASNETAESEAGYRRQQKGMVQHRCRNRTGGIRRAHQTVSHLRQKRLGRVRQEHPGRHELRTPPTVGGILAWSKWLHHGVTFSNGSVCVRTGCALVGCSAAAFDSPLTCKAKQTVYKLGGVEATAKWFVTFAILRAAVLSAQQEVEPRVIGMWMLIAYVFLRVPSECLPLTRGDGLSDAGGRQSVCGLEEARLIVRLE